MHLSHLKKENILIKGKSKIVYATNDKNLNIIEYTNQVTAFNKQKVDQINEKGKSILKISSYLFKKLNAANIKTHYLEDWSENQQVCLNLKMLPLEVILRNKAAGSVVKKYNIKEKTVFNPPLITFDYKNDDLGDPMLSETQIVAFKIATQQQIEEIKNITLKINEILKDEFKKLEIDLIDFKLEFGINNSNEIILADELGPDNMRLVSLKEENKHFDKDVYRLNLDDIEVVYKELANLFK